MRWRADTRKGKAELEAARAGVSSAAAKATTKDKLLGWLLGSDSSKKTTAHLRLGSGTNAVALVNLHANGENGNAESSEQGPLLSRTQHPAKSYDPTALSALGSPPSSSVAATSGAADTEEVAPDVSRRDGVHIRGLSKVFYGAAGARVAVDELDLSMYEGQVTCLLGHNGM
jgi:hypothetical protein